MNVEAQIEAHFATLPAPKRREMEALHRLALEAVPGARLWFLDGRDESGKTVSNPSVGYGVRTITYASGKTKEFYQVGISANTAGISVYVMGLRDKTYLAETFGARLGKASVSGYCIKFKSLESIDIEVLAEAMRDGVEQTRG